MDSQAKIRKELHQINNCMSIIIGNLDMLSLSEEDFKKDIIKRFKDMNKASFRITDSVQEIYRITES